MSTVSERNAWFEQIYSDFHRTEYLRLDPLELVHRYSDPLDQEVVAILAAMIAYGNVAQIRKTAEAVLASLTECSGGPRAFVRALVAECSEAKQLDDPQGLAHRAFEGLYYRFNTPPDFARLLWCVGQSHVRYGCVGAHFGRHLKPADANFAGALDALLNDWLDWLGPLPEDSRIDYFFTAPSRGSTCKRWCMLLRWMGRRDDLDPGLWTEGGALWDRLQKAGASALQPRQLVFPLDTHTGKIARRLKLTRRKSLNWRAALEVTRAFARVDPLDPVRFDFALCRAGMVDFRRRKESRT